MLPVIGTDPIRFSLLKSRMQRRAGNPRESTADCLSQSEQHQQQNQQNPPSITLYPITGRQTIWARCCCVCVCTEILFGKLKLPLTLFFTFLSIFFFNKKISRVRSTASPTAAAEAASAVLLVAGSSASHLLGFHFHFSSFHFESGF